MPAKPRQAHLIGFIGGYLVNEGALTLNQLDEALQCQIEWAMQGRSLAIDRVLLEMGFVNEQQLKRAFAAQAADRNAAQKHGATKKKGKQKSTPKKTGAPRGMKK